LSRAISGDPSCAGRRLDSVAVGLHACREEGLSVEFRGVGQARRVWLEAGAILAPTYGSRLLPSLFVRVELPSCAQGMIKRARSLSWIDRNCSRTSTSSGADFSRAHS